jgi:hypothetical protein
MDASRIVSAMAIFREKLNLPLTFVRYAASSMRWPFRAPEARTNRRRAGLSVFLRHCTDFAQARIDPSTTDSTTGLSGTFLSRVSYLNMWVTR